MCYTMGAAHLIQAHKSLCCQERNIGQGDLIQSAEAIYSAFISDPFSMCKCAAKCVIKKCILYTKLARFCQ